MGAPRKHKLPNLQVLIDYKDLQELLVAAAEVDSLRVDLAHAQDQIAALRSQFVELMDVFREIND